MLSLCLLQLLIIIIVVQSTEPDQKGKESEFIDLDLLWDGKTEHPFFDDYYPLDYINPSIKMKFISTLKGYGLVTIHPIPKGTILLKQHPVFIQTNNDDFHSIRPNPNSIHEQIKIVRNNQSKNHKMAQYLDLLCFDPSIQTQNQSMIDDSRFTRNSHDVYYQSFDESYKHNCKEGLFGWIAKINHKINPNSHLLHTYNHFLQNPEFFYRKSALDAISIISSIDIPSNTQITISYLLPQQTPFDWIKQSEYHSLQEYDLLFPLISQHEWKVFYKLQHDYFATEKVSHIRACIKLMKIKGFQPILQRLIIFENNETSFVSPQYIPFFDEMRKHVLEVFDRNDLPPQNRAVITDELLQLWNIHWNSSHPIWTFYIFDPYFELIGCMDLNDYPTEYVYEFEDGKAIKLMMETNKNFIEYYLTKIPAIDEKFISVADGLPQIERFAWTDIHLNYYKAALIANPFRFETYLPVVALLLEDQYYDELDYMYRRFIHYKEQIVSEEQFVTFNITKERLCDIQSDIESLCQSDIDHAPIRH